MSGGRRSVYAVSKAEERKANTGSGKATLIVRSWPCKNRRGQGPCGLKTTPFMVPGGISHDPAWVHPHCETDTLITPHSLETPGACLLSVCGRKALGLFPGVSPLLPICPICPRQLLLHSPAWSEWMQPGCWLTPRTRRPQWDPCQHCHRPPPPSPGSQGMCPWPLLFLHPGMNF